MVLHTMQHGRDGSRMVMQILTPRRYERKLMETVRNLDEKAFIMRMSQERFTAVSGLKAFELEK